MRNLLSALKGRRLFGNIGGLGVLLAEPLVSRLIPRGLLELFGVVDLPDEIRKWGAAAMWSLDHVFYWLPVGLGLAIICWVNWEAIKLAIKTPAFRAAAVVVLLALSYFVPDVSGQDRALTHI